MDGYKIITLIGLSLVSITQLHAFNFQQLSLLGRNMCRRRTTMNRCWQNAGRRFAQTRQYVRQRSAYVQKPHIQVAVHASRAKQPSWWHSVWQSCGKLFIRRPNVQTQQWQMPAKEFNASAHADKQQQEVLLTAALLGAGTIASIFPKKSRVIYADEPDDSQGISFTIDKKEMENPELMRAKLAQYHEEQHPEVALKAMAYLYSFLDWKWKWAFRKALHKAPESVKILIEFIVPHCVYVADNSADCKDVLEFIMQETPELLDPIKETIAQDRATFEQTQYGKKILETLNMKS